MAEPSDDEWHLVAHSRVTAADVLSRKQIKEWESTKKYWSGIGQKHVKHTDIKGKIHIDGPLGSGGAAFVERITYGSVTMARKKIDRRRHKYATIEKLKEEANIMDKLVHRHIVTLVGTYTHGSNLLYLLTYPVAVCDLHHFLDDIEDVRLGTSADIEDAAKRFENLGFKGITEELIVNGHEDRILASLMDFLASVLGCVTEALEYVHGQRIRHQDLKPSNILLSPGQVYLADFGISMDLKDSTHSVTDSCVGWSPGYVAPEVEDKGKHHPSSADIYSLGCVFLNVATVLYGSTRAECGDVMREKHTTRAATIENFVNDLRPLAVKTGKAHEHSLTCMPKHLLGLTEAMLSHEPSSRPTASQVNAALHDIGGIEQIYHGNCCKKDASYVAGIIDSKMSKLGQDTSEYTKKIKALEEQHEHDKQAVAKLSEIQATYQLRLEKERNHLAEQYARQLERQRKELEAVLAKNKALEAELATLKPARRGPRKPHEKLRPPHLQSISTDAIPKQGFPLPVRRQSNLPVPVRPSTPLPSTPVRPQILRDSSSATSTLLSSVHSSFSRQSPASSVSSIDSETVRSDIPDSPMQSKAHMSPTGSLDKTADKTIIMTWAERARGNRKQ